VQCLLLLADASRLYSGPFYYSIITGVVCYGSWRGASLCLSLSASLLLPTIMSFPPLPLGPESLVLITDHIMAPGDFVIHRTVAGVLKDRAKAGCMLVLTDRDWERWKAIAARSNVNLAEQMKQRRLVAIDATRCAALGTSPAALSDYGDATYGPALLNLIRDSLGACDLVILDNVSTLEWAGMPPTEVVRLLRALRALCSQKGAALLVRAHTVGPVADVAKGAAAEGVALRHLRATCDAHVEVRPLVSGRSGAVSGEIAMHAGPLIQDRSFVPIRAERALQYRLTDSGAVFFERGTGGNVL